MARQDAARLLLTRRWAAVATIENGPPLATKVAFAREPGVPLEWPQLRRLAPRAA